VETFYNTKGVIRSRKWNYGQYSSPNRKGTRIL